MQNLAKTTFHNSTKESFLGYNIVILNGVKGIIFSSVFQVNNPNAASASHRASTFTERYQSNTTEQLILLCSRTRQLKHS